MIDDHPDDLDPSHVQTKEDLARLLRVLRARADSPSYRQLEKQALERGDVLARTTLGEVLNGRRLPSKAFLRAFLGLCGIDPDTDRRWERVWNRLAVQSRVPDQTVPAEPSDSPAQPLQTDRADRIAGALPQVWNIDPRNPEFTGRDQVLQELNARLNRGGTAVVQALRGMGGVGKSQLAIEYAHRFAEQYSLAWWIAAEDRTLIGEQFAALAVQLGLAEPGADIVTVARILKAHLRGRGEWLLIFDNVEAAEVMHDWLPGGPGHVLITSRAGGWERIASSVALDVMDRAESVSLLRHHHPELEVEEAGDLADTLGDLPLALAQAGGFLAETGTTVPVYLRLLADHPGVVLAEGATDGYPRPLAAAIALSMDRLGETDSIGLSILRLCAFFAPETVPVRWLLAAPRADEGPLSQLSSAAGGPMVVLRGVSAISKLGLAVVTRAGLRLHRLTRGVVQDLMDDGLRTVALAQARVLLVANRPGDPEVPTSWPDWAQLVPHLLAANPGEGRPDDLRKVACEAVWYLIERGDIDASVRLGESLVVPWRAALGAEHADTLLAARGLARAYRERGSYQEALLLYEDTLPRYRRTLGDDHPDTLRLAHGMAIALHLLGRYEEARQLQSDTLARYRTILGVDHPHALHSANHLAVALREIGQVEEAMRLHQDTWERYRRMLGDDHPDTLRSAANLALDLRTLGQVKKAKALQEQTLRGRQEVLGDDHLYTLQSASGLAETMYGLGMLEQAHNLQQETLNRAINVLGDQHPETLQAARNLVRILKAMERDEEATALEAEFPSRRGRP